MIKKENIIIKSIVICRGNDIFHIELGKWARENLNKDVVILSSNPSLLYLLSFKKGVFLIYSQDKRKISFYIHRNKVSHILADTYNNYEMRRYIYPWIYENKDKSRIQKINGAAVLLKID